MDSDDEPILFTPGAKGVQKDSDDEPILGPAGGGGRRKITPTAAPGEDPQLDSVESEPGVPPSTLTPLPTLLSIFRDGDFSCPSM